LVRNLILAAVMSCMLHGRTARAAQSVTLAWDPPAGAAGFYVYCGTNSGVYNAQMDTGTNTMVTVTGLTEGHTNYFKVTAYNSARMMGTPSGELSFLVPGCIHFCAATRTGTPASLSFPVAVGHTYEVQASTNLQSWTNLWQTTTCTSNAWVSYQDPQAASYAKRFYRLIMN
jgi:hypothetical protein